MFTDQSGSVSDTDSTSSSYSSLSNFVYDIQNSDINGDTPGRHCLIIFLLNHHTLSL